MHKMEIGDNIFLSFVPNVASQEMDIWWPKI